ncbi:hypothetical protein [Streptomyces sp. NPDC059786]|uniref:hypothetical protein n=1 Tax=Streptomyces sp. NPDC059786 TaxID=3346946 RepID=UPI00366A519E
MVDVESRLPPDAWGSRDGEAVTGWLCAQTQVRPVCRDGSGVRLGAIAAASSAIVRVSSWQRYFGFATEIAQCWVIGVRSR